MFLGVGHVGRQSIRPRSGASPTFSMDFTQPGTLPPGAVFARTSSATYFDSTGTLQSAGAGVPRWDYDPVTHALNGLLLEETRTNLALHSSGIGGTGWSLNGNVAAAPVVTPNAAVAPDGTTTASQVVLAPVSGAGAYCQLGTVYTATAAAYTHSVWLRGAAGGEQIYLMAQGGSLFGSAPLITLTTAWKRYTYVTPTLTAANYFLVIGTDLRDVTQAATAGGTVFMWGAQVELGAFMTSYIPTVAATVTRAVDTLSVPIANVPGYDTTKGTMFGEYILEGVPPSFGAAMQFIGASQDTDYISFDQITTVGATPTTPTLSRVEDYANGASIAVGLYTNTPIPAGQRHRGASSWAIGSQMNGAHDGVGVNSRTNVVTATPVVVNLTIAGSMHFQPMWSMWARSFQYWPRQMSQSELISLTTIPPSLDMNFMSPGVLPATTSFSRASTATYTDSGGVIRTAAANVPRWDYNPATGLLNGLLLEGPSTNVFFPSVSWAPPQAPTTALDGTILNADVAPDGTNTAMLFVPGGFNGVHQFFRSFTGAVSTTYTFSTYAKAAGYSRLYMELANTGFGVNSVNAAFDLTNGALLSGVGTSQYVGNGWWRLSITATTLASAGACVPNMRPIDTGTNMVFTGNMVSGILSWGHQVEAAVNPSSYIATVGASATRAVDSATFPSGPWRNLSAETFFAEYLTMFPPPSFGRIIGAMGTGSAPLYNASATTVGTYDRSAVLTAANSATVGAVNKAASQWVAPNNAAVCVDGGPVATSTSLVNGFPDISLFIVMNSNGGEVTNGYMRRLKYWPGALTQAQMQQVTT